MRKQKIYLDTSVISHLDQSDVPDKMNDTLALWEEIKRGLYEVYISEVVIDEITKNRESKLNTLLNYLADIEYTMLTIDEAVDALAGKFIEQGILREKSIDDCYHIAFAMRYGCDAIISWNFKHIYNIRMIRGVKIVSGITGYPEVSIYSPTILIEGDD